MANTHVKKVAILFAGGPAPAANAVISCCAESFMRHGIEVVGIKYGYSNLIDFDEATPLEEGEAYMTLDRKVLRRTRNRGGIIIGTARSNPGKHITCPADFDDEEKAAPLKRVYNALRSIGVDALVSIGGDDTLKTANKFKLYQEHLPEEAAKIPVVHVPKTIDNDYSGIDFTFGYFTAVETLASEIRNLVADAEAGRSYFMVETMGRSAGWLAYGASISGEASLVISVEDIAGDLLDKSSTDERRVMDVKALVSRLVRTIRHREEDEGKQF
ncbi:MAG: 6-phosphofructokinase, partial [Planctomycetaceae bacterium]